MNFAEIEKMTIEQIESMLKEIIFSMKKSIEEEEKTHAKTANYAMYKERLTKAEELKKDIEEYKQNERDKNLDTFFLGGIRGNMFELTQPIY